jgi:molybdopterin synthase sulfur carrier subunit
MSVIVRIPTPLRALTSQQDVVQADGDTLLSLVQNLEAEYPGMSERIVDEDGEIRRFVNLFVNGEDVRFLDGLATALGQGDEVSIVPAVAGG